MTEQECANCISIHSGGAFATMMETAAANADVGAVVGLVAAQVQCSPSVLSGVFSVSRRLQFTDIHRTDGGLAVCPCDELAACPVCNLASSNP